MVVDEPGCITLSGVRTPSLVLCRTVEIPVLPEWNHGPAPFCQPSSTATRYRGMHASTDVAARMTLVSGDLRPVLYGDNVRRWLPVGHDIGGLHVVAMELCAVGDGRHALLAAHLTGTSDPGPARRPHAESTEQFWETLRADYLGQASYAPGPIRTVSYTSSTPTDALTTAYQAVTGLGEEATRRAARHTLTVTKPDWSALALRDGLALVAHPVEDHAFAPHLKVQTHSIFLDALILAWVQRVLLDRSGARAVAARLDVPDELVELERNHFDFKRTAWRRSLTHKRTAPVDEVLVRLQHELLTDRDVEEVEHRVRDGARLARTLHQEESARAQEDLNNLVQRAAVVIGALGLAYAAAPTIAQPGWVLFLWATAAGLGAMLLTLGVLSLTGDRTERRHRAPLSRRFSGRSARRR